MVVGNVLSGSRRSQLAPCLRIPNYWIVDGDAGQVEVWTPDLESPHFETIRVSWSPGGGAEPFTVELDELFRPLA